MQILLVGFKTHSNNCVPEMVYAGNSGDDALAAVAARVGEGFVRFGKIINPQYIPVQCPEPDRTNESPKKSKK